MADEKIAAPWESPDSGEQPPWLLGVGLDTDMTSDSGGMRPANIRFWMKKSSGNAAALRMMKSG